MPAAACCGFHWFVVGLQILALICPPLAVRDWKPRRSLPRLGLLQTMCEDDGLRDI